MRYKNQEFQYHGDEIRAPYFEGWYYKITDTHLAFACIVGIAKNEQEQHAFIQTIDTLTKTTHYYRFGMDEVVIVENPFTIQIGKNSFSNEQLFLQLSDLQADIKMSDFTPLQTTAYAPSIMGPFAYVKKMQCVHSIISLQHSIKGTLNYGDRKITVSGIGYIEKDRGVSFPKEYIWVQSNSSEIENSCFFLSIAHIPILKTSFTGCICVFMVGQKQYRFASYLGVRIHQIEMTQQKNHKEVNITLVQFSYRIELKIRQFQAYPLLAPESGVMEPKVFESLDGEVDVLLYHRGRLVCDVHFKQAGSELRFESESHSSNLE